jgi:hypothetical protein
MTSLERLRVRLGPWGPMLVFGVGMGIIFATSNEGHTTFQQSLTVQQSPWVWVGLVLALGGLVSSFIWFRLDYPGFEWRLAFVLLDGAHLPPPVVTVRGRARPALPPAERAGSSVAPGCRDSFALTRTR